MSSYRVTVEMLGRPPEEFSVTTARDVVRVMAAIEERLRALKGCGACKAVVAVLHEPDCDHEA